MSRTKYRSIAVMTALAIGLLWLTAGLSGRQSGNQQPSTKNGDWPYYTADLRGSKYSPLDQINASNFNQLVVAWRFKTEHMGPRPEYKLEGTPLVIRGTLYATAGSRRDVISLDARTGEMNWV